MADDRGHGQQRKVDAAGRSIDALVDSVHVRHCELERQFGVESCDIGNRVKAVGFRAFHYFSTQNIPDRCAMQKAAEAAAKASEEEEQY